MFRKATIAVVALIAMAGVLTGCSTNPAYTGTAIIKEHNRVGKQCYAKLEMPNKKTESFYMGRKATCYNLKDGTTVTMKDGSYQK